MPPVPPTRKPVEPPTRTPVELEATGLDEAGHGTGMSGGRTLHVADLLPGERAEVAIDHDSPHRPESWGRIARRLGDPSPDRVAPACPAHGRCGGCAWQPLAYPAQLVHKRARVVASLPAGTPVAPATPSPSVLGYRHKGKYVAGTIDGKLVLGAWAPRRHELVDTAGCRVVAPLIDELRGRTLDAATAAGLAPWDERARTGHLRYVIIRANRTDEALVILVVRSATPPALLAPIAAALTSDPRVAGVLRLDNDRDDGGLLAAAPTVLAGAATIPDTLAGVPIDLGATEFAQVNPAQADAIYARVAALAALTPTSTAADVYAGLGGITFALARSGAHVISIERDPDAVSALRTAGDRFRGLNPANSQVEFSPHDSGRLRPMNLSPIVADARTLAEIRTVDVVVVNPPRKGLSQEVIDAIVSGSATRLIYVSCGPESLGRDVAKLVERGWVVDVVEPFDLMPGTAQIETVVRLERKSGA